MFYCKVLNTSVKWVNKTYNNEEGSGDESVDVCSLCGYAGLGCGNVRADR